MAHRLDMADAQAILALHASGYSGPRISQLLRLDRETVRKSTLRLPQTRPHAPGTLAAAAGAVPVLPRGLPGGAPRRPSGSR